MTKNDKVKNWSQEIHVITLNTDFEHIKGSNNTMTDSLSTLKALDLYEANDPKEPVSKYFKSTF